MDRQTKMNDLAEHNSQVEALSTPLVAVAHDVAHIAELQKRLFAVELRILGQRLMYVLAAWLVAMCLLITILPVALSGFGLYLAYVANIRPDLGLLWVACAAAFVMIGLGAWGWLLLRNSRAPLSHSYHELQTTAKAMGQTWSEIGARLGQHKRDNVV